MYLPRLISEGLAEIETASPEPELPRARIHECILVVEDDLDVLAFSMEALKALGYQVVGAKNADQALSVLDQHPDVTLLFTDVELPGLNGPELVEEARRQRPGLAVLYTTGYTANAVVHRGLLDQSVRSLNKPFTLAELATTVRGILDDGARGETLQLNLV